MCHPPEAAISRISAHDIWPITAMSTLVFIATLLFTCHMSRRTQRTREQQSLPVTQSPAQLPRMRMPAWSGSNLASLRQISVLDVLPTHMTAQRKPEAALSSASDQIMPPAAGTVQQHDRGQLGSGRLTMRSGTGSLPLAVRSLQTASDIDVSQQARPTSSEHRNGHIQVRLHFAYKTICP